MTLNPSHRLAQLQQALGLSKVAEHRPAQLAEGQRLRADRRNKLNQLTGWTINPGLLPRTLEAHHTPSGVWLVIPDEFSYQNRVFVQTPHAGFAHVKPYATLAHNKYYRAIVNQWDLRNTTLPGKLLNGCLTLLGQKPYMALQKRTVEEKVVGQAAHIIRAAYYAEEANKAHSRANYFAPKARLTSPPSLHKAL
jgi:hypothetical protein